MHRPRHDAAGARAVQLGLDSRSPFAPDRSHIHHRLLDLGLSHRDTVLVIYGICAALGVLALLVSELTQLYAFLGVFIVSGLILFAPTRGAFRRPEELEAASYESTEGDDPTGDDAAWDGGR